MDNVQPTQPISRIYLPEGMLLGPADFLNLIIENKDILQVNKKHFNHCWKDGFAYETEKNNGTEKKKKVAFIGKLPFKGTYLRDLYSEASHLELIKNYVCDDCLAKRYGELESKRAVKKYLPMVIDSKNTSLR